jgi:hypothetical protein
MTQNYLDLLTFAFGFLGGCVKTRKVTLNRLEEFAFDEAFNPLDGQPVMDPDPNHEELLRRLAHTLVVASLQQEGWDKDRINRLGSRLGEMLALGHLTPTTIATLCNTSVDEFQEGVDDSASW